ncbi:taste receptor type 2 member 109-like isoform X1 [Cricetulus griseus]|uniref:taste receptor type 2 member 109-like isoform X1 n=1 Tax=Cricetulus griseus TaxID=10029 RepID=UPI00022F4856|nr:taste receptor type 2 member 109-like isoform X1 [Cricetulus griseus]
MEHFLQSIYDIFQNTFMIILIMEVIIGNLGNGFLALVNCMNWVKRKKISFLNQILTALAASRMCLLWLLLTCLLISSLYPDLTTAAGMIKVFSNLWIIVNHSSIWLSTCLGVFYFLKITNFSNSLFLYLKWRVKKTVSVTLLLSLIPLFFNILLVNLETNVCISEFQRNISYSFRSHYYTQCYRRVLRFHTIFLFVPFGVCMLSFLLLIFSLWEHYKKMQQRVQRYRDASTTAHIKALQIVTAFLLLYTIFILSLLLQLWKYELINQSLFISFCQVIYVAFPSFHSCVLILGDVKLRQACLSLCCGG